MSNPNQELKKLFSEFKFQEIVSIVSALHNPSDELLELKANSLFELGDFEQAKKIYKFLKLYNNLGFCFLLEGAFENAKDAYLKASVSSARKWGLFLVLILSRVPKVFPGPGYLTFRLFFESSYGYFLKFRKLDYIHRIHECSPQLKMLYPDLEREIEKAKSVYQERLTQNT